MTTHFFRHTFIDGSQIVLTVDLSTRPMTVTSNAELRPEQEVEYRLWRNEVVVPALVALSDADQIEACANEGLGETT